MKHIALLPNPIKDADFSKSRHIGEYLLSRGAVVYADAAYARQVPRGVKTLPDYEIFNQAECVVTLGGDGTLLRIAKPASIANTPILGINYGKIGYMAELEYNEIDKLSCLLSDDYTIEERLMLAVTVTRGGREIFSSTALNDAVISRGIVSRLVDLDVSANGSFICAYRADGLIVSTPTGSTGYSMSAGGPILEPSSGALILTPICPHSLAARSIVFAVGSILCVTARELTEKDAYLTIDGYETLELQEGDVVTLSKSENLTRLIRIKNINFYKILNHKLGDGGTIK